MNIFQAIQVCNDIKKLYQTKDTKKFVSLDYNCNCYAIRVSGKDIIWTHRVNKHLSPDDFVPTNLWTNLLDTAGNFKTIPTSFTVIFNNNGVLPHAPEEKDYIINGLAAHMIYNKIKKEHLADWHKTLKKQREQRA